MILKLSYTFKLLNINIKILAKWFINLYNLMKIL